MEPKGIIIGLKRVDVADRGLRRQEDIRKEAKGEGRHESGDEDRKRQDVGNWSKRQEAKNGEAGEETEREIKRREDWGSNRRWSEQRRGLLGEDICD
jgi:hypothetical protein